MVPGCLCLPVQRDRKSTRLNSSHPSISYADFCLKQKTVPRPQGLEPRPSISPYRRVVGYSLREQKPLDPVHMLDPLRDQCPSLPAKPAAVLFFRRRRNHPRANPPLARLVGQKRPPPRLFL